jgi:CDP-diglyceride synthetase
LIEALILVLVANGTPVIASRFLGKRLAYPVDLSRSTADGYRWLGESKTIRGVVLAIVTTALAAFVLGHDWKLGAMVGVLAMAGDIISSFIKRRMGMAVSSQAPGLDQVPESLLPLAVCAGPLGLQWYEVLILVGVFWVLELLLSRVIYALNILKRPY